MTHRQYISSLPVKSRRTPPKDRELFDNVYNRHPKAAEVLQMLRQDGGPDESPPRRNEVRYKIGFLEAQSCKKGNKDSDIPVGPDETGHPRRRWEENHSSQPVKGPGKSKPSAAMA